MDPDERGCGEGSDEGRETVIRINCSKKNISMTEQKERERKGECYSCMIISK